MNRNEIIYPGESTVKDNKIKGATQEDSAVTPSDEEKPRDPDPNNPGDYKVERVALSGKETMDWGLEILAIPPLWSSTQGEGVTIAVLDSGIAYNHPDFYDAFERFQHYKYKNFRKSLFQAVLAYKDFTGSPFGAADMVGHGTHVAGIIAARRNNGGIVGVAPRAKLLIGKVLKDNGRGSPEALAEGIIWASDHKKSKIDIISISLGCSDYSQKVHDAIKVAKDKGIFVICSAGNNGTNLDAVDYPARLEETVAVGAIDRRQKVPYYSSQGEQVDIVAPGDQVLSTYPPNTIAVLSGTSMATPFVSGVIALMLAKHRKRNIKSDTPIENLEQLKEHLLKTSIDLGPEGPDPAYGYGLINPADLLHSNAAKVISLSGEEDFSVPGVKKLRQFFGRQISSTGNGK